MKWVINCNASRLESIACHLTFEVFEELTNKKIDWSIRHNRFIYTYRDGKLKVMDEYPIQDALYKYNTRVYKCTHINKDNTVYLMVREGNNLDVKAVVDLTNWEIV
jgi:hypothetical protein